VLQLPTIHAVAIRLQDQGYGADVIATALGLDDDQVALLLLIAERKLAKQLTLGRAAPETSTAVPDRASKITGARASSRGRSPAPLPPCPSSLSQSTHPIAAISETGASK
jgi:hypothetical protein